MCSRQRDARRLERTGRTALIHTVSVSGERATASKQQFVETGRVNGCVCWQQSCDLHSRISNTHSSLCRAWLDGEGLTTVCTTFNHIVDKVNYVGSRRDPPSSVCGACQSFFVPRAEEENVARIVLWHAECTAPPLSCVLHLLCFLFSDETKKKDTDSSVCGWRNCLAGKSPCALGKACVCGNF